MFEFTAFLWGFVALAGAAVLAWLFSLVKQDVSIVDSLWGPFFALAASVYAATLSAPGPRTPLVLALVFLWALRLAAYVTWRNWGQPEDRRYQAIRRNHEPRFALKSLYIVFGLQGLLAWLISLPLLAAMAGQAPVGQLELVGVALWAVGMVFEAGGDWQLARFKARPENRDRVLESGFWRYTRHPNYFGEFCIWWGYYLIAAGAGGWWSVLSPLLMTFLLLKVSGVAMLEADIGERRPGYREYVARTNAFFPGRPKRPSA
jgi:steroid 5-alpha reductase family enzyme